jgi:hypothetical protein
MSQIEIIDECQDHNYFSLIPNIIYCIGLTSNQISIYGAIKMVTGEKRDCIMCLKKLSKHAGMSLSTFVRCYPSLSEVNPILKKPLIIISKRIHENGDQDTNSIKIVNIWPQNMKMFSKDDGGSCQIDTTPCQIDTTSCQIDRGGHVKLTRGSCQIDTLTRTYNKKGLNKTTTPTPLKKEVVVGVLSKKTKEAIHEAATGLKGWLDTEAYKPRDRVYEKGNQWGSSWIFPLSEYIKYMDKHGIDYVLAQVTYMRNEQMSYENKKRKTQIITPTTYLRLACKENYADFNKGEING